MSLYFSTLRLCVSSLFVVFSSHLSAQVTNCGITVNAGPDLVYCNAGQMLQLNGSVSGDFLTAAWSPAAGLANPNSLSTSATASAPATYSLTVRSLTGPNLVANGDFSQGNAGFTTNYTLGGGGQWGPVTNPGTYGVTTVANLVHSQFAPCTDHTGGGQMMVVNGATTARNIWCQTVTVQPATEYAFSAWFAVVATQNPSILRFTINNVTIGNNFTLPTVTCEWTRFFRFWNSGAATTAEICIANVSTSAAGNDFCLDDISLRQVCETADQLSISPANLNAAFNAVAFVCENSPSFALNTLLAPASTPGGQWTINGAPATAFDPAALGPGTYTVRYRVEQGACSEETSQNISVAALPQAGTPLPAQQICGGAAQTVTLAQLLSGADPGGSWTHTSSQSLPAGAFDAAMGTIQTQALSPGGYTFQYRVTGTPPCPDATATVTVSIVPSPVADAGQDQTLDCRMRTVSIGGANTSIGADITYAWSSPTGGAVVQSNFGITDTEQAGTYVLAVRDVSSGCEARDTVVVTNQITSPQFAVDISPVTCNGDADGSISVSGISGAADPLSFQLNGGAPQADGNFENLPSGVYTIRLEDANGCFAEQQATLPEPPPLGLELTSDLPGNPPLLKLGESTNLRVLTNLAPGQISSLTWEPEIPGCDNCLVANVSPVRRTDYLVTLEDANGCRSTAGLTILIDNNLRVFVPNAFSPNDDGINDRLALLAGPEVTQVLSFRVADRWGSIVFQQQNIPPNDPQYGWDGRVKGKPASPGVFAWFAELELADGRRSVVSGEAALLR